MFIYHDYFLTHLKNWNTLLFLVNYVSNHPAHIINEDGKLSPSSFIPFCGYGSNISTLGVKIDQFDFPVCNSFRAKVLNDQLCYEVDVNELINRSILLKEIKMGLMFMIDHNEDRQVYNNEEKYDHNNILKLGK